MGKAVFGRHAPPPPPSIIKTSRTTNSPPSSESESDDLAKHKVMDEGGREGEIHSQGKRLNGMIRQSLNVGNFVSYVYPVDKED